MAPTFSDPTPLGSVAPQFKLPGVDGKTYDLPHFADAKALVIAFMCNHCPYVIAVQGRINELAKEYEARGVRLVGINSNDATRYPDDNFEAMKLRAKEQGYVFPYLRDETQEVAQAYGAVCTPEFYVYRPTEAGKFVLKYKGRLDDSWKDETAVTRRELAMALDAILANQEPISDQKPAMGCSIKWKTL
jgi:peroxiredoxin